MSRKRAQSLPSAAVTRLAVLAIALGLGAPAVAATGRASAAVTKCGVGSGRGYGYTYLLTLQVKGTTCGVGVQVVKHKGKLSGWRCAKKVLATSPFQYDARMTCTNGSKQVVYEYTQNTG
jgi:hypothetical protein